MSIKLALAGNPNAGKTTMFNALTGSNQYVGNWPGVTVEKKEGKLKNQKDVTVIDLPGIYSLSPYTLEEVITRDYILGEKPDVIINLVDASNIERNLYLTTQLTEMGFPVIVALNMMDVVRKNGDKIDTKKLSEFLGCPVVETSAVKGEGLEALSELAVNIGRAQERTEPRHAFGPKVETALDEIEATAQLSSEHARWYTVKLFERDEKAVAGLGLFPDVMARVESIVSALEEELDDDSESIITDERYQYVEKVVGGCVKKTRAGMTTSDKIDQIVTNRWLALPIFALIMFVVYFIAVTTVGDFLTGFMEDTLFGEVIGGNLEAAFEAADVNETLSGLVLEGIVGGVGSVLSFVPQMLVLFLLLAILEDCGYMARVAFIMDRIFRKFGLSGKSFIPMLIGSGCSVPGIMASRTIEQERDRRMTIMTTAFIPCGAKMPIIALIAGALFGGAWWVAPSAYFIGVAAVIVSGIMLKKFKAFAGDPAPFVMELPQYHVPTVGNVLRSTWERGWSFIKKAGTIILLASMVVWFLSSYGFVDGSFGMVDDLDASIIAAIGSAIAPIFAPLGFNNWQASVATVLGLIAKEEVVSVFGVLFGVAGDALELVEEGAFGDLGAISMYFTAISAYSFMIFNLLCAPCFAAIGAIKREMNNGKWTLAAVGYMTVFAYTVSLIFFQFASLLSGGGFTVWTAVAVALLAGMIYLLVRPARHDGDSSTAVRAVDAVNV